MSSEASDTAMYGASVGPPAPAGVTRLAPPAVARTNHDPTPPPEALSAAADALLAWGGPVNQTSLYISFSAMHIGKSIDFTISLSYKNSK